MSSTPTGTPSTSPAGTQADGSPSTFAPIVRAVRGSVVSIFANTRQVTGMQWGWSRPQERYALSKGTGFLIAENGERRASVYRMAAAGRPAIEPKLPCLSMSRARMFHSWAMRTSVG